MLVALLDLTGDAVVAQVLDEQGRVLGAAAAPAPQPALVDAVAAAPDGEWLGLMVLGPETAHEQDGLLLTPHDALVARLTGVLAMPLPYAARTGLLDVPARCWDADLLQRSGSRVPPLVESGTVVGEAGPGWGVPEALPVVSGAPAAQLSAVAAGATAAGLAVDLPDRRLLVTDHPSAPDGWSLAPYALPGLWALTGPVGDDPGRPVTRVLTADAPLGVAVAALVARGVGAHAHLPHAPARPEG